MEEPAVSYPSLTADTSLRLQQLVNGWRGAERGEPLTALHNACVNAVGPGGCHLVPAHVLLVPDLDMTNLHIALRNLTGKGQGITRQQCPARRARCFSAPTLLPPGRFGSGSQDVPCYIVPKKCDHHRAVLQASHLPPRSF